MIGQWQEIELASDQDGRPALPGQESHNALVHDVVADVGIQGRQRVVLQRDTMKQGSNCICGNHLTAQLLEVVWWIQIRSTASQILC